MKNFLFLVLGFSFFSVPFALAETITGGKENAGDLPTFLEHQLEKTGDDQPSKNAYSFRKMNFGKSEVNFNYIREKNKKLITPESQPEEKVTTLTKKIPTERFPRRNSLKRKSFNNVREFALELNIRKSASDAREGDLSVRGRSDGKREVKKEETPEKEVANNISAKNFQGARLNKERKSYATYSALKVKRKELQLTDEYVRPGEEDSWQRSSRIWNKIK